MNPRVRAGTLRHALVTDLRAEITFRVFPAGLMDFDLLRIGGSSYHGSVNDIYDVFICLKTLQCFCCAYPPETFSLI